MVSEKLTIPVVADTMLAEASIKDLNRQLDSFTSKEARVRRDFTKSVRGMMNTMRSLAGLFRSTMSYFGQTLDPVQEAILTSIYTSLTAILAMHRALEATTVGVAGAVTVGLSMLAMGMSIAAIGAAQSGMDDARAQTDRAMNLMIQLETVIATSQIWT
ncbi:unnamed protein product [marine sediment metagenome]|uniref:Uncharacterized protein n=1 Tax=marine sediment metagenome TaxID=412755 RepID=X0U7D0_9ZZZZ